MDLEKLIEKKIKKNGEVRSADIIKKTGFTRAYVNRFFQKLRDGGRIVLIGKANQARYVLADEKKVGEAKKSILSKHLFLKNVKLDEDLVLSRLKRETGIWQGLKKSIADLMDYSFTEMLNNAIEHSKSSDIKVIIKREKGNIGFRIVDRGIGIFASLRKKANLKNNLEAIENLLKGKQTTAPKEHSGEGVFFTSKVADILIFKSEDKKLIFNNLVGDVFIGDIKGSFIGTEVNFSLNIKSNKNLNEIFRKYSDDSFIFSKTKVGIKLFEMDTGYISRSQARRLLIGLDKFKTILLDFKNVKTVGQAFIDEVFRVWCQKNPAIEIKIKNANQNIDFMIKRAVG